jgi:hypothetical protein
MGVGDSYRRHANPGEGMFLFVLGQETKSMTFTEWYAAQNPPLTTTEATIAKFAWEASRIASPPATAPPTWTQGPPTSAGDFWCLFEEDEDRRPEFVVVTAFDDNELDLIGTSVTCGIDLNDVTWHQSAVAPEPPEGR